MTAPLIGPIELGRWLATGQVEQVLAGGENYGGARPCNFDWIKSLSLQCKSYNNRFVFLNTGTRFVKDGKIYHLPDHQLQSRMALKAGVNHDGNPLRFRLFDPIGFEIDSSELYQPVFKERCLTCGNRPICNGCSDCGHCK